MTSTPRGVFVGHTTHDRFGPATVAGGSAWFAARAWRALGGCPHLVTTVGADFEADDSLADLDADVVREGRTTVFHNRYDAAGARVQWVEAVAPAIAPPSRMPVGAVPGGESRPPVDVTFLAPVFGEINLGAWASAARRAGARIVALGVQGWTKRAGPRIDGETVARRVVPRPWRPDRVALTGIDVAVLSDDDLAGQDDLLARLRAAVPLVALTHGRDGATLLTPSGPTSIPAFPTTEVDATGAGDTFAAALLFGLAVGRPPAGAGRLAAAAASIVVEARGGAALARLGEAYRREQDEPHGDRM